MSVLINASTSTGLVQSADTSGEIELQSNGTTALKVNTNEGIQILNCLGVGNATPSTSGAGITFPATQSASSDANTLDDYEEGTFSPIIQGTTTAGTATYTTQNGRYTKIGRLVQFQMYLGWTSGTGTGSLEIAGLPFTAANTSTYPAVSFSYVNNLTLPSNNILTGYINNSNTNINLNTYPLGGGSVQSVSYDANAEFVVTGTYLV